MVKVEIYIPKEPVHPYMQLRAELLNKFPGMTESPMCVGAWKNSSGVLVQEGITVLTLLTDEIYVTGLKGLLSDYKVAAKQEEVLLTVSPIVAHFI